MENTATQINGDELSSIFTLPLEWVKALYSLEYCLTKHNIMQDTIEKRAQEKTLWLQNWETLITNRFNIDDAKVTFSLICDDIALQEYLRQLNITTEQKSYSYLILIEAMLFRPFFKIDTDQIMNVKSSKTGFRYTLDKSYLGMFTRSMSIDEAIIARFKKRFDKAMMSISGRGTIMAVAAIVGGIIIALTAGVAAPAIAVACSAPGLYGAAAISSGLAWLGGGAIAIGGYGMVGGITVLVSSGGILGIAGGATVGAFVGYSPDLSLFLAAKLEVFYKEVLLPILKDPETAKKILDSQSTFIDSLKKRINEQPKDANKVVSALQKAIKYLDRSLARNQKALREFNQ